MFTEFLDTLHCKYASEEEDWREVCRMIRTDADPMYGFQPAVTMDTEAIRILETTDAVRFREHTGNSIWIVPFGAHERFSVPWLRGVIRDFYEDDELPDTFETCGAEFEEMICLEQEDHKPVTCIRFTVYSRNILWLIVEDSPEIAWNDIVERYALPIHVLADSWKGMGDWFESVPLYDCVIHTKIPGGMPKYYLKGLYISHPLPEMYEEAASYDQLRGDLPTVIGRLRK